jgi:NAD(P)-dependent dehydrogenase (short-subunit alcohol dehydrogenase family)
LRKNINLLNNKIVVITGGAGVLGRTFVRAIVENGGIAIAADIDLGAAMKLAEGSAGKVEAAQLDITNDESVLTLIHHVLKRHGSIDAVVNNAYPRNKNYGRLLESVSYEDFCENTNLHLGGYFLVAQKFCQAFKEQGFGNVVNISSIYGSKAPNFEIYDETSMTMPVEYAAIKSAIEHLTRYFAQYYKGYGIRVNSLSPGGIVAGQPDKFLQSYRKRCSSKGMLDPDDLCGALIFLLSNASQFMTGQNLIIDDGFSL